MSSATEELKIRHGLDGSATDAAVRTKIKRVIARNHPDKTGGDFKSDGQKERYNRAIDDLRVLDAAVNPTDRALVTALEVQNRQLTALIESAEKSVVEGERERRVSSSTDRLERSIRERATEKYRSARWSGYGLAAFGVLLVSLKEPLEGFFGSLPENSSFRHMGMLVAISLMFSGVIFAFLAQVQADREVRRKQRLLTENGFRDLIRSPNFAKELHYGDEGCHLDTFSIEGLAAAVEEFGDVSDEFVAQEVAELTAEKLVARGLAHRQAGAHLSPTYRLVEPLAEEILFANWERERGASSS
jgi:hypothetical protein